MMTINKTSKETSSFRDNLDTAYHLNEKHFKNRKQKNRKKLKKKQLKNKNYNFILIDLQ